MPVIDASVLVEYFGAGEYAATAWERMLQCRHALWAPHLIDAEVGHSLRRAVRLGDLEAEGARQGLEFMSDLPLRRVPHEKLLGLAWELRDNVSFYDALYVSLARALDEPLITFDARLARANGIRAEIEVLGQAA
jgi:predicted nucleic acid-binding protein